MSLQNLKAKLDNKKIWVNTKYDAYEQARQPIDPSKVLPIEEKWSYRSTLGWCSEAVDKLLNTLTVDSIKNDTANIWPIFNNNNRDILLDSAFRSALISACSFIYISKNDGEVNLQLIDGHNATGVIDPITFLLKEGYAILDVDDNGNVTMDAYFTPEETVIFDYIKGTENHIPNPSGYPLLVPIIYRPDSDRRPFGQSRISKALIDIQNKARNTVTCMEVAREFGAFPQKYVSGLSQEAEFDTIVNAYKTILAIDKDSDGDKPTVGQFTQISLSSYISQFEKYREEFDREAGLDTRENLNELSKEAKKHFSIGLLNVGLVSASLRDETKLKRAAVANSSVIWLPSADMNTETLSSFGDAIIKINQSVPNAINANSIRLLTGLPIEV